MSSLTKGTAEIAVSLIQFVEEDWQKLRELYQGRQKQIEEFLASARGF
jgi:hypothetical protein